MRRERNSGGKKAGRSGARKSSGPGKRATSKFSRDGAEKKKSFGGDKSAPEKKWRGDKGKTSDGSRKPFGRSPDFAGRRDRKDENPDRKNFHKERGIGGEGPREEKSFGEKPPRRQPGKPFDKRGSFRKDERSSTGDDKPRERRSFGEKSSDSRTRKPFEKRGSFQKDERGPAGEDKPRERRPFGEKSSDTRPRKPYEKRESFQKDERGPAGEDKPRERKPFGEKSSESRPRKPYVKREPFQKDERKPFRDNKPGDRDSAKRFDKKPDDRPWNRKEKHSFYGDRKKSKPPTPKFNDDGSTRLNKYIANAGICSRREADELITAGVVSVNGEVITQMGYKVMPGDVVKYNNEHLRAERLVYILLNKPKDFITTTDDPEDRKTVMSLIAKAGKERVYPVGRLDRNTTGLLLFTNDGDLAKKLTHPSFEVHKVYQVELDTALKTSDMDNIVNGITLNDGFIKPDEIVYTTKEKNVIGIELHSGKNRIVRRIFEHLGYEVKKLDRVVFAGLTKKDLPRGRWRFLTEMEIAALKMLSGKTKAKSSVTN